MKIEPRCSVRYPSLFRCGWSISFCLLSVASFPGGLALGPAAAHAQEAGGFEYSAGGAARSTPLGAGLFGAAGYGVPIWGSSADEDFRYGYVLPQLRLSSSGVTNRAEAALHLFPISIAGVVLSHAEGVRFSDPRLVDCESVACRGRIGMTTVRPKLILGFGPFFFVGGGRISFVRGPEAGRPFADEMSVLVGRAGRDRLGAYDAYLGSRIDERHRVGLYLFTERMIGSGQTNDHESIFVNRKQGRWAFTLGAGFYRSSLQKRGPTSYFTATWTGLPSIQLD